MSQPYHANSATFALPDRLRDKSVHMFTLNDEGPSDFTMVICMQRRSRASSSTTSAAAW